MDDISNEDLVNQDQDHLWLKALRRERVYFSSPLDLDFAMLRVFNDAYMQARPGGLGPRTSADAIAAKKASTLKTNGDGAPYGDDFDDEFTWYPYLFLSESKPEAHLRAMASMTLEELANGAPVELRKLVRRINSILNS